jgi:demethylmenaquinone methyltransferase/2-methoxy-6-polyprenyl-1,4-benzoquinol methylase
MVPPGSLPRTAWNLYVDAGLPLLGRLVSPGWHEVGRFLGPSIRAFSERYPLPRLLTLCGEAGIEDARARRLSFGGGVVLWGRGN